MKASSSVRQTLLAMALIGLGANAWSCNSVATSTCTPGVSVACTGPNGCSGYQVCKSDGASFEACVCGGTTGPGSTSTSGSSGTSGASTTSSSSSSSSGSGGGGGAAPFTPAALPGLSLWLNPDAGVIEDPQHAGVLLKWQDQSGNGNTATSLATQDGLRFDIDPSAINGHDAFHCRGPSLEIADDPSVKFGTGGFTIAEVVRTANTVRTILWDMTGTPDAIRFEFTDTNQLQLFTGSASVGAVEATPNAFHIVIVRGPMLELRMDGSQIFGTTSTANIIGTGNPIELCSLGGPQVEIAEVVAVKGTVSDANLAKLQAYLQTKYAL